MKPSALLLAAYVVSVSSGDGHEPGVKVAGYYGTPNRPYTKYEVKGFPPCYEYEDSPESKGVCKQVMEDLAESLNMARERREAKFFDGPADWKLSYPVRTIVDPSNTLQLPVDENRAR